MLLPLRKPIPHRTPILSLLLLLTRRPATVLTGLVDGNGLPDLLFAARVLDERGGVAEGGEGEGCVGAPVWGDKIMGEGVSGWGCYVLLFGGRGCF
jgi:hypothetical protein